jgi:hypothetical protein
MVFAKDVTLVVMYTGFGSIDNVVERIVVLVAVGIMVGWYHGI